MLCRQVSVFLENKSGRLAEVCQTLGEAEINIRALCIADTSDFGILRLIVDDPDRTVDVLQSAGFSVGSTGVLALRIPDRPGGLGGVLGELEQASVNVEYMYAFFITIAGDAVVLFKVDDDALERTLEVLEKAGVPVLASEAVYRL
ncbi:MAG: amino acid-binding protein [candidate division WS1 bacterium]|nr:amino acid-binding protein [candidate division WS1 bacterium]